MGKGGGIESRGRGTMGRGCEREGGLGRERGGYLMDCMLRVRLGDMEEDVADLIIVESGGSSNTYVHSRGKRLFMNAALVDRKGM